MSSSRLPGKVMLEILDRPILSYLIDRIRKVDNIDEIIIATTENKSDDILIDLAIKEGVFILEERK